MQFNETSLLSKSSGSRRKRRRPGSVRLNARLKAGKGKEGRGFRLTSLAVALSSVAAVLAVCLLMWFGLRLLGGVLFSSNDAFTIRKVDIKGSAMITEDLIREYTQVREGMNLFRLDIGRIREDFLRRAPSVKSMEISRLLPGTLSMEITERMPLARLGWRGPLVVDRKGVVFVVKGRSSHLPVITGYKGAGPRPGARLRGSAIAALEVLDVSEDYPALGLGVEAIEVDNREHLMLRLSDRKSARLAWNEMGTMTPGSRDNLLERLGKLSVSMRSQEGRRRSMFDATLDGPIYCH